MSHEGASFHAEATAEGVRREAVLVMSISDVVSALGRSRRGLGAAP